MMKLERIQLLSRLTTLIRLVLTCVIVTLVLIMALRLQQVTSVLTASTMQSHSYDHLLAAFAREETIQDAYQLHPSPALITEQLVVTTTIVQETGLLQQDADPTDEALGKRIAREHTSYRFYSGQFFTAINTNAFAHAQVIRTEHLDPLMHQIEQELRARLQLVMQQVTLALAELETVQHTLFVLGLCVLVIGILLIASSVVVMRNYRRMLGAARHAEVVSLQHLAITDPLTGLGNHFAYQEHLALQLQETTENGAELVLALLDLDAFRHINDEQGHQCGDAMLKNVALLMREAKISAALFRLSGDAFAMILPYTSLPEATVVLERLRENIQRLLVGMSVSIGIAHTVSAASPCELLRAQAAAALEEAKQRGRNRVVAFSGIAGDVSIVSFAKARAARQVLSERKVSVVFQPIWDLDAQQVLAFEALSRPDPSCGLSGPQELFDVIERIGRAHELDVVCVEAILARATELPSGALLFLNLSPQSLVHDLLTEVTLLESVVAAGLEPSQVVLEITERAIVHLDKLIEQVRRLQALGFRVALDDAGAGNAGLEMLSRLPVDFVKIDRMVLKNALTDQAARSVFLGLTTIARELGIDVVAEGIETSEMIAFVQQAQVRCAQGYLLGRPSATIPVVNTFHDSRLLLPTSDIYRSIA